VRTFTTLNELPQFLASHWYATLSGLGDTTVATQGRPSLDRANLGLNETILSGLKNGLDGASMDKLFIIPPKKARNCLFWAKLLMDNNVTV
jgi:hypothetical protein